MQTSSGNGEVTVTLTDNGPGIPEGHLQAVFDKFHQVGDTLTGKPKGTGLGLTICRHILEHFGGRIGQSGREAGRGLPFPTARRRCRGARRRVG